MGHTSVSTTLDLYGHLFPDANRSVLNKLDRLVGHSRDHEGTIEALEGDRAYGEESGEPLK